MRTETSHGMKTLEAIKMNIMKLDKKTIKELKEMIKTLPLQPQWINIGKKDELIDYLLTAEKAGYLPVSKEAGD